MLPSPRHNNASPNEKAFKCDQPDSVLDGVEAEAATVVKRAWTAHHYTEEKHVRRTKNEAVNTVDPQPFWAWTREARTKANRLELKHLLRSETQNS